MIRPPPTPPLFPSPPLSRPPPHRFPRHLPPRRFPPPRAARLRRDPRGHRLRGAAPDEASVVLLRQVLRGHARARHLVGPHRRGSAAPRSLGRLVRGPAGRGGDGRSALRIRGGEAPAPHRPPP